MTPIGRLKPPLWMTMPETGVLIKTLKDKNITARFVGGCVRDAYLGRPVFDIDMAVDALPQQVIETLEPKGISCHPTGIQHGTLTVVVHGKTFQVTSLRTDVETHGRHATVAFVKSWVQDARRRDFTINALYADANGYIFDPCGEGLEDLQKGRVRFIGNPLERIEEDTLRILRFFRFTAHYAKEPMDVLGLKACMASVEKISTLSAERISYECHRLFSAYTLFPVLKEMDTIGILKTLFPFCKDFDKGLRCIQHLHDLEQALNVQTSSLNRMVALFQTGHGRPLSQPLKFSKQDTKTYGLLTLFSQTFPHEISPFQIKKWLYIYGSYFVQDFLLLNGAVRILKGLAHVEKLTLALKPPLLRAQNWRHPPFLVRGRDIVAEGVAPGPLVSNYLNKIRDWWIDRDFQPSREECLNYFHTLLKKS